MSDHTVGPESLPQISLLYGDDFQALRDRVNALSALMGDPTMADMNISRMDGAVTGTNEDDVRTAAYTLPFLSSRRMVILFNPVQVMKSDSARQKFLDTLANLPETTALVLVQDDVWQPGGNQRGWKIMHEYREKNKTKINPLLEWARSAAGRVSIEIFRLPALNVMPGWLSAEVKRQGGRIQPQAATALAAIIGSDTGQGRQEIAKLLSYVDFKRPIEVEDVNELVAPGGQADVFVMVEAMAQGDSRQALRQFNRLLEEQDAPSLFAMVLWQYRLIIMAKDAVENGVTSVDGVAGLLGVHSFPAGKALNLSRRYTAAGLNRIYHRLLEIDLMTKTGKMDLEVGLQAFIAEMGQPEKIAAA